MSIVTLVSGGLDSTVMALLTREEGLEQYPLFIDYGQLGRDRELGACRRNFANHALPAPKIVSIPGYGEAFPCGLTDRTKRIFEDAFLPCRNMMFLTIGAAYAKQVNGSAVAIGLLDEAFSLFPDQTQGFLRDAEAVLARAIGQQLKVVAPLMSFSKQDVVNLAKARAVNGTYSCHSGAEAPCGICVACREYVGLEV